MSRVDLGRLVRQRRLLEAGCRHVGQRAAQVRAAAESGHRVARDGRHRYERRPEALLRLRTRRVRSAATAQVAAVRVATPQIRGQRPPVRLRQRGS